ncbi:cytochrome-c peroxidase [Planctomycetota bacterium]
MWLLGCKQEPSAPAVIPPPPIEFTSTSVKFDVPLGLPELMIPKSNPLTAEKIDLGRKLFFDKNLSLDRSMSCATCHDPEKGWSNDAQFAIGVTGDAGSRNVPTVVNSVYATRQFWDGRETTLESQALGPLTNPIEMAMPSLDAVLERVRENDEYVRDFQRAFDRAPTIKNLAKAIASFERIILLGDTPYDRYVSGDESAMSESAIRGLTVFRKKGRCTECHKEPIFTDRQFYNLGIGMDAETPDVGRFAVTKIKSNIGRFKTPGLRNVTRTAPYMHDGSVKTLEEVIDIYDKGGIPNEHLSSQNIRKLELTKLEKADLLAFMVEGLTGNPAKPIEYTRVFE